MRFLIPFVILASTGFSASCNQEKAPALSPSDQLQERVELIEARNGANPSAENRAELLAIYEKQSQDETLSPTKRLDRVRYIAEALYVAGKHDDAYERLRKGIADFPEASSIIDASLLLAELAIQRRQEPETAELIFATLRTNFENAQALTKIPAEYTYVTLAEAKSLLQQQVYTSKGFEREAAVRYARASWAYTAIESDPRLIIEDHLASGRIMEQAKNYSFAIKHYDEVINRFPDNSRAGDAMMLKAVVLQDVYSKNEEAKILLNELIVKHPSHDLADDAKSLLASL